MREAEELSRVIGEVYDASLDPALWPHAIESICGYVGAASASLHSQDSVTRATDALFWWGRASTAPHYFKIYLDKYGKINPIFPGVVFFDLELPVAVPDVISCEEFVRTRFFQEWLAPQSLMDGLFSNLEKGATSCALFTAMRHTKQGPVDDRMRRRFELITPHVRRSMLISKVIDLHRFEAAALADSLDELASGVIIVDSIGRIIHANASAHHRSAARAQTPGRRGCLQSTEAKRAALEKWHSLLTTVSSEGEHLRDDGRRPRKQKKMKISPSSRTTRHAQPTITTKFCIPRAVSNIPDSVFPAEA